MITVVYGYHTIQVRTGLKEEIRYDGLLLNSTHTWSGGTYIFSIIENQK